MKLPFIWLIPLALVFSCTLDDVPACVLSTSVCPNLLPGTLGRLSLVSQYFHPIVQKTLRIIYGKGMIFDVERLYDLYHSEDDSFEKGAIQRLIEANLPAPPNFHPGFDRLKSELFTPNHLRDCLDVSKHYPELSRMVLKHKKFVRENLLLSKIATHPSYSDLMVRHFPRIDFMNIEHLLQACNPRNLAKFLPQLQAKSKALEKVLQTGDFEFLLNPSKTISMEIMFTLICLADESNMETVLLVLEKFEQKKLLTKYLVRWTKYENVRPILIRLIYHVDDGLKSRLAVEMSKYPNCLPLYLAMRGNEYVGEAIEFLDGQNPEDIPYGLDLAQLVETALILDYPDDIVSMLIDHPDFRHHFCLVVLALTKKRSTTLILKLVQSKTLGDYCLKEFSKLPVMDIEVFKFITRNRLMNEIQSITFLLSITNERAPPVEFFKFVLNEWELTVKEANRIKHFDLFQKSPDLPEIRLELLEFALEKGYEIVWSPEFETKELRDLVLGFFDKKESDVLLQYLSKCSKTYLSKGFYQVVGSSYSICVSSISTRPGGFEILRKHFSDEGEFMELMLAAQHPRTDFEVLLQRAIIRPANMSFALYQTLISPYYSEQSKKFLEFLTGPTISPETSRMLLNFFEKLLMNFMRSNFPVNEIYLLKLLNVPQLKLIFQQSECNFFIQLENTYYRDEFS